MLRTCELAVESNGHDGTQEQREECNQHDTQDTQQENIAVRDGQDVSKQKRRQVGSESRSQKAEDNSDSHAERPEHGDGRIFAHVAPLAQPFHTEGRQHRKDSSREQGRDTRIKSDADTTKRSMRNASADEYQSAGNDVRPDDAAGDAGKQTAQQGMLEKSILQQF